LITYILKYLSTILVIRKVKNERQTAVRERSPPFAVVRRRSLMIKNLKKRLSLSKKRTFCLNAEDTDFSSRILFWPFYEWLE
jgi:hypothetical protein